MKKLILAVCALAAFGGWAAYDQPDVLEFGDTGYHAKGWFSFEMSVLEEMGATEFKKALIFDSKDDFVLSPRYPTPVRKVVVCSHPSSANPTRKLCIRPYVDGIETDMDEFGCCLVGASTEYETTSFDFSPEAGVDALRLCMSGGGTGNWHLARVLVFYGTKDADEDDILRQFAKELPPPENLRAVSLTTNSLTLASDSVADADGYRFAIDRLEGLPRTEDREDFVSAPALSTGWKYGTTNHVSFGQYAGTTSSSYPDNKTSSDGGHALQIVPDKKGNTVVQIISPVTSENVTKCSYVCKASSNGTTDRINVYGRKSADDSWESLGESWFVTASKAYVTNAVPFKSGIRQVMFEFSATASSAANCGLDTLRIVYGGNEEHISVKSGDEEVFAEPRCTFDNLTANARYAFRVKAVAAPTAESPCHDSSWSNEQVVDLSWASIKVASPTDVDWEMNGAKMTVRWAAVADADHYLVDVIPLDDPEHPVVSAAKTTGTSFDVTVPFVGEYSVKVTAVSPGGISTAASEARIGEVELGALSSVALKAVDRQAVEASWSKVPLAEGYQAKLFEVVGEEARCEIASVRLTETKITFRNLDPNGRYAVAVTPLPSEGETQGATSPVVDLSAERFRQTGAVPLSKVREGAYFETFESLSNVSAKVETRSLPLDYWQLDKGAGEAEVVLYSSKTNFTAGGVYVWSDESRTPSSFMLGTLATGSCGCTLGIAFHNDTEGPVGVGALSFDSVQRTFKKVSKGYVLEWAMTDGATGIDAESEWQALTIPVTAPHVAGDPEAAGEYRQTVEITEGLPAKIPVGCVLILRWRHEKVASGPAMGVDNVRLEVDKTGKGFGVIVK